VSRGPAKKKALRVATVLGVAIGRTVAFLAAVAAAMVALIGAVVMGRLVVVVVAALLAVVFLVLAVFPTRAELRGIKRR
jgi:hypothetical protein